MVWEGKVVVCVVGRWEGVVWEGGVAVYYEVLLLFNGDASVVILAE